MNSRLAIDARQIDTPGIGRYIQNLLSNLDVSNTFVLRNPGQEIPGGYETITIDVAPLGVKEQICLPELVRRRNIDILHSTNFNVPLFTNAKQITTIHDCAYSLFPEEMGDRSTLVKKAYKFGFHQAIKASDHILTVSTNTKQTISALFDVHPDNITVTRLAATTQDVSGNLPDDLKDREFMLYVGSDRPRKNLSRIIDAYASFTAERDTPPMLVLAGPQNGRFVDVNAKVRRLGIKADVLQLGFVPQPVLDKLYREAILFLFPSLYEGFGLPALEAIARRTPVVTSPLSSLPEVVGDAGVYVDPYNTTAIADELDHLWSDDSWRQTLSRRCVDQVKKFSWQSCARETKRAYKLI